MCVMFLCLLQFNRNDKNISHAEFESDCRFYTSLVKRPDSAASLWYSDQILKKNGPRKEMNIGVVLD